MKARSGMNIMIRTLESSFLEMQMLIMELIKKRKGKEDDDDSYVYHSIGFIYSYYHSMFPF